MRTLPITTTARRRRPTILGTGTGATLSRRWTRILQRSSTTNSKFLPLISMDEPAQATLRAFEVTISRYDATCLRWARRGEVMATSARDACAYLNSEYPTAEGYVLGNLREAAVV